MANRTLVWLLVLAVSLLLSACGLGKSEAVLSLVSIEVAPTNPAIAIGTVQQFTATAIYSDNTTKDITSKVVWTSSNPDVAGLGSSGAVTSLAQGNSNITASLGGMSGTTILTVSDASLVSISVTSVKPVVALGATQQFTATGIYSDNTKQNLTQIVTWNSSDQSVGTISNTPGSRGLVSSLAVGNSTITASLGSFTGSGTLTVNDVALVSITVDPVNPRIALGTSRKFTATGLYSDNTTQDITSAVTWSSSDSAVATVSNVPGLNGWASSASIGNCKIKAEVGGISSVGISGVASLTVTDATLVSISVTPPVPGLALGLTQQFTATGIYTDQSSQDLTDLVTWSSSNTGVAAVSNAPTSRGMATSVAPGSATVTAALGSVSGITTLTVTSATLKSISVDPASPGIASGTSRQFTATGIYTDNTTQDITALVVWDSSNPAVANISNASGNYGLATSVSAGNSIITASLGGFTGSTTLTVTSAVLTGIVVDPVTANLALGTMQQFTATGIYTDSTTQDITTAVTWSSDKPGTGSVSSATGTMGMVTALAVGNCTIKATMAGISGTSVLDVTNAVLTSISVTPAGMNIPQGTVQQYTATGTYSDSTTQDLTGSVTWGSSSPDIASVSNAVASAGLASAVAAGNTTITAASAGISGGAALTVNNAVLLSITVTPINPSVNLGDSRQFTATGNYSDNIARDITDTVIWSSASPGVATVSNASGSKGLVNADSVGTSTITATSGNITGSASVTGVFSGILTLTPRTDLGAGNEGWDLVYTEPGWGTTVTGTIVKPIGGGPFPGVVLSHGKGGNANGFALEKGVGWFAPNGYISIAVDLTHAGSVSCETQESQCAGSAENVLRGNRAFQILRSQVLADQIGDVVDRNHIMLYGNSLGAMTTIELAENLGSRVSAAAMTAGGIFLDKQYAYMTPNGSKGVNMITAPFMHMHGRLDNIVNVPAEDTLSNALDLYDKIHQQVWFPNGHDIASATLTTNQVRDFILAWFSAYLLGTEPKISTLSVQSAAPGDSVVISGSNFGTNLNGNSTVKIGGVDAVIISWSDTSITASVPAGAMTGSLEVIVPVGPITDPVVEQPVGGGVRSNRVDFTVL